MKFKLKLLTLALALSFMLTACGNQSNKTEKKEETKTSQAPKEKEEAKKEETKVDPNQSKVAAEFDKKVNSIKEASLSEEFTLNSLNEEYKKMKDSDKKQVKTKEKLDSLTKEIKALTADLEKKQFEKAAKEFDSKVKEKLADSNTSDINISFLDDEFNTLEPKVQELVSTKDELKAAVKEANARRIKAVEELIDKINSKSKDSKEYLEAETAYELLDKKELKEQVKNADKLK